MSANSDTRSNGHGRDTWLTQSPWSEKKQHDRPPYNSGGGKGGSYSGSGKSGQTDWYSRMGGKQGGEGKGTHPPGPPTPPASSWSGKAGGGTGGKQQEGKGKKGDPGKGQSKHGKNKSKGQDTTTNQESGGKPEQSAGQEKIDRVLALPGCAIYSLLKEMGGGILLTTPAPSLDDAYDESPELGIGRGVSRVEGTPPYTYGSLPGLQHAIKESKWLPYFHEELNLKPDDVPNHLLISYEMIPDHARPGFLMEILEITRDLEKKLAVVDWA